VRAEGLASSAPLTAKNLRDQRFVACLALSPRYSGGVSVYSPMASCGSRPALPLEQPPKPHQR